MTQDKQKKPLESDDQKGQNKIEEADQAVKAAEHKK